MIFEIVCNNCNTINRDDIPLLSKKTGMDMLCMKCDEILFSFYDDNHPLSVMRRS